MVQVIVYAGAIVVLFLFVIMFLGVDREENIAAEPLRGQRRWPWPWWPWAHRAARSSAEVSSWTTGAPRGRGRTPGPSNVALLGQSVYTTYLFPFEVTAALLVIAVVGAVVLARRPPAATNPDDEVPAGRRRRRGRCAAPTPAGPTTRRRPTGAGPTGEAAPRRGGDAMSHQRRLVPGARRRALLHRRLGRARSAGTCW